MTEITTRRCNNCKEVLPISEFYRCKRNGKNDWQYECKPCQKERVKARYEADPEHHKDLHLRRSYGITLEDFNQMVIDQDDKCACCGTDKPGGKHNTWAVDHCHVTEVVRDLLCKDCNIVLGIVQDSPEHLQRLIAYLVKHSTKNKPVG